MPENENTPTCDSLSLDTLGMIDGLNNRLRVIEFYQRGYMVLSSIAILALTHIGLWSSLETLGVIVFIAVCLFLSVGVGAAGYVNSGARIEYVRRDLDYILRSYTADEIVRTRLQRLVWHASTPCPVFWSSEPLNNRPTAATNKTKERDQ